ncbi:uncharacterized protein LOC118262999 [Spodoptera frugiperda]|uniref:Uncharacterized protein LOC118262999 n=1 Tax=Spodoptera frugiperda TaxID=7108 RepID=A0A9R0EFI0_SPOFR|nr:uncharacterized protein LOC118262999 [Spodoptera frugiperda]
MYRIIFFIILAGNTPYSRTLYPVRHIRASDDSGDDYSYVAGSTEASDVTLTADPLPDKESCARLNGVCAEIGNCPRGSKIEIRGLCPDEDDNDMECCIPYKRQSRCCHTRSACVPKVFECSQHYRIYEKIYMAT